MVRQLNFILTCVIIILSFILIFNYNQCNNRLVYKSQQNIEENQDLEDKTYKVLRSREYLALKETLLQKTRLKIQNELSHYDFTQSGVQKLEDLVLESGGSPVRSLVVTSWRSGSTFFGELLNAMPSNFYHYEPLLKYQIRQIRGPPFAASATNLMKNMLFCNYSGMEDYFEYGRKHLNYLNQFEHNKRLWQLCKGKIELCFDADFTGRFCRLFPFHSMKVVRYRMGLAENFLADERLNIKVILLIRDPRGVLQSRRYRHYCQLSPDCIDPRRVCQDMVDDYMAAARLKKKYPGRVMTLRFEDLSLNLNTTTLQIQKFLKLGPTKEVAEFLHSHTNILEGGIDSTFRVTKNVPFKWKKDLDFEYVQRIQGSCTEALQLWGYNLAHNATHMTSPDFYPISPYSLKTDRGFYSINSNR